MSMMFLPHFDFFCDLLLNRRCATWNLLVLYDDKTNINFLFQTPSAKAGLCPGWRTRKKLFDVINYLYKMNLNEVMLKMKSIFILAMFIREFRILLIL